MEENGMCEDDFSCKIAPISRERRSHVMGAARNTSLQNLANLYHVYSEARSMIAELQRSFSIS